jgi:hypothetical protein
LVEPINPLRKRIEQHSSITEEMQLRACSNRRSGGIVLPMRCERSVPVFHWSPALLLEHNELEEHFTFDAEHQGDTTQPNLRVQANETLSARKKHLVAL